MNEMTSININFPAEELQALDRWTAANGISRREDAVRQLVQLGLRVAGHSDSEADVEAAPD